MVGVKVVSRRQARRRGRLTRPLRLLILLATLWPLAYFGLFALVWLRLVLAISLAPTSAPPPPPFSPSLIVAFFVGQLLTMLLGVVLLTFYVVHLFRNARVEGNLKAAWAIILLMGGIVAMPAYWYLYIWREPDPPDTPPQPQAAFAESR